MLVVDIKTAFDWTEAEYKKVEKIIESYRRFSDESVSNIVSSIKSKDEDNDISKAINWLKYSMPYIVDKVYKGVKNIEDLPEVVSKIIYEMQKEIDITYDSDNPEKSSFNTILDVYIDDGLKPKDMVEALYKDCINLDKYWKQIFDTETGDDKDDDKYNP